MRYIIVAVLLLIPVALFAAAGDKTPATQAKFHIVSSSTKPARAAGELRYSAGYLYLNISSAARPHWRRIGLGAGF